MTSVQPVEIKIFGSDQPTLQVLSKQVAALVGGVSGTADVFDGIVIAGPSISMEPNNKLLAQYGITPANLQFQLQTALEGNVAGAVFEKEQLSNIRLVYPGSRMLTVADIAHLQIFLPDGKLRPLTDFATVKINNGEAEISRENLQSMGIVTARLDNRDLGTVMKEISQKVSAEVRLPPGYSITYGAVMPISSNPSGSCY